jgi:hypothetical protein
MTNHVLAAAVALLTVCAAPAAFAAPDLIPIPSRISTGTISVKNQGDMTAGPSIVTLECNVQGGVGGCAESAAMARFTNPAYPNKVVVKIPKLAAGKTHSFKLPFWAGLVWAPNNYQFSFLVDSGGAVAEGNEGNNAGVHVMALP